MDRNHDGFHKPLTLVPEAGVEPAWTFWVRGILTSAPVPEESRPSVAIVGSPRTSSLIVHRILSLPYHVSRWFGQSRGNAADIG